MQDNWHFALLCRSAEKRQLTGFGLGSAVGALKISVDFIHDIYIYIYLGMLLLVQAHVDLAKSSGGYSY